MNCKVLIMNSKGSTIEGFKVSGMEIPKKRNTVRQKVIKDKDPNLILIQESDIVLSNICTQDFGCRDYQAIGGKDAGIVYDTTTFIQLEDPTNRLRQIYEFKFDRGEILSSEIMPRMCARIMQGKNPNAQKFLLVSWHGPHTGRSHQEKKKVYEDLLLLLKTYSHEKKIPIILGGDFNLDLREINQTLNLNSQDQDCHHQLKLLPYVKLDHRPNKLDYILTSQTIINEVCKPVDIFRVIDYLYPEVRISSLITSLDHDPITVNVNIPRTNGVAKSATVLVMKVNRSVKFIKLWLKKIYITLMQKVIKEENPDLILLQESNFALESICTQKFKNRNYQSIEGESIEGEDNNAAIIYDSNMFNLVKGPLDTNFEIDSKYYNLIKRRMCAVELKEKVLHAQQFLCVSWQGPYSDISDSDISYNDKKQVYQDLSSTICLYLKEKQIPVVLGGDFNLDLNEILPVNKPLPSTPLLHINLLAHDYTLLAHRINKFVFTLTSETITNVNGKTVDIFEIMGKVRESILKLVLDHDPLAVNLTIPVGNLEESTN